MTRWDFLQQAIALCVGQADETKIFFVEPLWQEILKGEGYEEEMAKPENRDLLMVLDLAARKANAKTDKTRVVMEWMHEVVSGTIEPIMTEAENDLVQNAIAYIGAKRKATEIQEAQQKKAVEQAASEEIRKQDIQQMFPGMVFKKGV